MELPTTENPRLRLPTARNISVMRGYEVIKRGRPAFEGRTQTNDSLDFVGAVDGPLVEINAPGSKQVYPVHLVRELIAVLQAAIEHPIAEAGAHDADIVGLGYEPIPGRS